MSRTLRCLVLAVVCAAAPAARAQKEYGFDNRKSSGQPYLSPEETVRRMKVADGFEVKLFAAEPLLVNPIAFTIDERGRIWAIESFEYPKRTPAGKMPRDRIVILEDTDGDGIADKRTIFAEGKDFPERFDLASGIEVGHGGVFVGAPPYLWFIENKNDKPGRFEKLLSGFGSQDTHEMLNTFQWGPDGWLYGLHGIFTQSKVTSLPSPGFAGEGLGVRGSSSTLTPNPSPAKPGEGGPDARAVEMNAAMWRYHPTAKKFEVVAEGTSNPWGWDYRNTDGQMILACCVIPHLFHITPGGVYKRQSGQGLNPYAYGSLNEICDHTFHKESGWAHAGLLSLDSTLMPPEYRDSVIFGSIHGNSLKRNVLKRNGSTYTASRADDFLVSGDKNVRPLNLRWGPNGDIYLSDWHDQNPCSQADPDSWDYERGRIYRIQKKGAVTKKAEDLGKKSIPELDYMLADENPYRYRTALRLLAEKVPKIPQVLRGVMPQRQPRNSVLADMWGAHIAGAPPTSPPGGAGEFFVRMSTAEQFMRPENVAWRVWLLRHFQDRGFFTENSFEAIARFAVAEKEPPSRLQLASTAQRLAQKFNTLPLLHVLMQHKEDATDAVIPLMLWLAYEPKLAAAPQTELDWLKANAAGNPLVTDHILPRAMRRLVATGKPDDLNACVAFAGVATDGQVRRRALEGLAEGLKGRQVDTPAGWDALRPALFDDADLSVKKSALALAVSFRDPVAAKRADDVVHDLRKTTEERAEAVRQLAQLRPPQSLALFLSLVKQEPDQAVRLEAVRGLAAFDAPGLPQDLLAGWANYPPAVRGEAVNVLAGRREWARDLLAAVAAGTVAKTELSANVVLRIQAFRDRRLNDQVERVWGKVRATPDEITMLIARMRDELQAAPGSFTRGRAVFDNQCAKCHRFDGRGSGVGPELDGAGRDIDYLLVNVLDPNRVVGQPYFIRRLTLTDGRVEEGLLASEDAQTIVLKGENDARKTFARREVASVDVIERSMMPEGLGSAMTVQDFRDLVRYVMANPFLTDWQTAGPLPAARPDLAGSDAGVTWQPRSANVYGRMPLPDTDKEGYVYLTTTVQAVAAVTTRLQLGAGQPLRLWIDGKAVYEGQPAVGAAQPDQASMPVELAAGRHRVVIEVKYRGPREAVYARFLDPGRKLTYPEPASR